MNWDSIDQALGKARERALPHTDSYLGFYSSWLGGYFREPWAMLIPLDDHGFHRGDAVFEAARIHHRAYIDMDGHLKRLERSAAAIGMTLPKTLTEIRDICVELGRRTDVDIGVLRLYVTRGPGGFSPNPAEVIGHQIYAAVTRIKPPNAELYANGVTAMFSTVAAKDRFWSQIKSCNYLQNVLVKQEAVKNGVDFGISLDDRGRLCEGATENLMVLTPANELVVPKFDYTLRGTTVIAVMKMAEALVSEGVIKAVRHGDLRREDILEASEAAFVGTTLAVLPIGRIDGRPMKGPHKVMPELNRRWMAKMATDPELRLPFN